MNLEVFESFIKSLSFKLRLSLSYMLYLHLSPPLLLNTAIYNTNSSCTSNGSSSAIQGIISSACTHPNALYAA